MEKLKLRKAGNDMLLCLFTIGIYAYYVLFFLRGSIKRMESNIHLEQIKHDSNFSTAGKIVLAILAFTLASPLINFMGIISLVYVLLFVMWLITRRFRKRLGVIAYSLGFDYIEKPGWWVFISSNWILMAVLIAFVVLFGPFVALFRTIKMYNEIATVYNGCEQIY